MSPAIAWTTRSPSFPRTTKLVLSLGSLAGKHILKFFTGKDVVISHLAKRKFDGSKPEDIAFACIIPVLVLGSGLFAGLTLGLMSLDETQLAVLSMSGTPEQRIYANKIKPIRKNGHLLLVTLLLSNMILNESLPVISDPVLGGGVVSVAVSTILIVVFAEIIPQSIFTRHGLYLGAKLAGFTQCLIYFMFFIAWPVAKLLEFVLGPHHGIIYRRAELKELINMHSSMQQHGGDLKDDTVAIIGATLDLQEKVVTHAMTEISSAFMVSIDSVLDYELMSKIVNSGHSRVPVYSEVDVPFQDAANPQERTRRCKKIVGILLVKQCVLLDPKDATPVRKMRLNKVLFVPKNDSLLTLLDKFQEGRSHIAIVSRFSVEKAKSVKQAVKRGLAQRLRARVGISDSSDSDSPSSEENDSPPRKKSHRKSKKSKKSKHDEELGDVEKQSNATPLKTAATSTATLREQHLPADAVLGKEQVNEFLQSFDPAVEPLGIITLEDVVEELIGEEIWDEFDKEGAQGESYLQQVQSEPAPVAQPSPTIPAKIGAIKKFSFLRPRSAPPTPRPPPANISTTIAQADAASSQPVLAMPKPIRGSLLSKNSQGAASTIDHDATVQSEESAGAAKYNPSALEHVEEDSPSHVESDVPSETNEVAPPKE